MDNQKMLEILYRINACLSKEDWFTAKEYVMLEINKLLSFSI